jgi:3-deoxy-D-manno-octulosonic-acid transferase
MVDKRPWPIAAYRLLTSGLAPVAPLVLRRRERRGKEDGARLSERRGEASLPRPSGPLVWAHGASVGEVMAILPVIGHIAARGFPVLLTSGTLTSARLAAARMPPGVIHQFVPVDVPAYVERFAATWKPSLGLIVESELWPNLLGAMRRHAVPLVLVNGRVSDRSFARWQRARGIAAALLSSFDLLLAQSERDAGRFLDLGAVRVTATGNIKLDAPAPAADPAALAHLRAQVGDRRILVAASTHPGEEAMVVSAAERLRARGPGLLTVVVPRHPDRGAALAAEFAAAGHRVALRSQGGEPGPDTDLYIADTIGELGLFYRVAPIVFMGGSLVPHGGQNPIEAIKLGAAVLHGPHVHNFTEIYGELDSTGGALALSDATDLVAAVAHLTDTAPDLARLRAAGEAVVERLGGGVARTLAALEPWLAQAMPDQRVAP